MSKTLNFYRAGGLSLQASSVVNRLLIHVMYHSIMSFILVLFLMQPRKSADAAIKVAAICPAKIVVIKVRLRNGTSQ